MMGRIVYWFVAITFALWMWSPAIVKMITEIVNDWRPVFESLR